MSKNYEVLVEIARRKQFAITVVAPSEAEAKKLAEEKAWNESEFGFSACTEKLEVKKIEEKGE